MSYLDKVIEAREAVKVEMDTILEAVATENRTDLTEDETAKVDALVEESRSLDSKIEKLTAQAVADAKASEARSAVANVAMPKVGGAKVTREARTYSPENTDVSFVKDAFTAKFSNDYAASERLARHSREEEIERRSVGTGNFAGLVIPQYLVDLAAPFARAGRPTADFATNKMALPAAGMTLNISRMTTGTSTAVQAAENDAVSNTNADDTLLTVNVRTIAGQQDISKQAIERGTGIDSFIISDLIRGWHTTLDNQILNGDGTSGSILGLSNTVGIGSVTYTDASPTAAELYPKLANAYQLIQTGAYMNPTHWVMHPRRLAFLLAGIDGSNRPLVVPAANGAGKPPVVVKVIESYVLGAVPDVVDKVIVSAVVSTDVILPTKARGPRLIVAKLTDASPGVLIILTPFIWLKPLNGLSEIPSSNPSITMSLPSM